MIRIILAVITTLIVFVGIVVSQQAVVEAVAHDMSLRVSPDARPEQGSFYRSDHFPFAKAGVPSISLKEGRISDAPEKPRFNPDDEFAKKP